MSKSKFIVSGIRCKNCKDVIFSRAPHDFMTCSCFKDKIGNKGCAIDGGFEPVGSRCGNPGSFEDVKIYIKQKAKKLKYVSVKDYPNKLSFYYDWNIGGDQFGRIKSGKKLPFYVEKIETVKERPKVDEDNRHPYKVVTNTFYDLRSANKARQEEWGGQDKYDLAYRGNEMAGEAGEACNVIKKLEREVRGIIGKRDTVEHLAEELADVYICLDLIAMMKDIDLHKAIQNKFNKTSEENNLKTRLEFKKV